jgi:hypothetical protein
MKKLMLLHILAMLSGCDVQSSVEIGPCITAWDDAHMSLVSNQSDKKCTATLQQCGCDPSSITTRINKEYFCGGDRLLVDYYPGISVEVQTLIKYPLTLENNKGFPTYVKGDPLLERCFSNKIYIRTCTEGQTTVWCDPQ